MKKLIFLLLGGCLLLVPSSCSSSDEESLSTPAKREVVSNEKNLSFAEAASLADSVFNRYFGSKTRGNEIVSEWIPGVLSNAATRSSQDTVFLIMNRENEGGFVLLSARRNATVDVIAVTDKGHLEENVEDIENPGLYLYLSEILSHSEEFTKTMSAPQYPPQPPTTEIRTVKVSENKLFLEPRVTLPWEQHAPQGYACPNGISGCTVTAGVLALSYFELPKTLSLTYEGRDCNSTSLDWTNIKKIGAYVSSTSMSNATAYEKQLARLCRELGNRSNADYKDGSTGLRIERMRTPLMEISGNVLNVTAVSSGSPFAPQKMGNGIIIQTGWGKRASGKDLAHTWIICGYDFLEEAWETQTRPLGETDWTTISREVKTSSKIWINWGWYGTGNTWLYSPNNNIWKDTYNEYEYAVITKK